MQLFSILENVCGERYSLFVDFASEKAGLQESNSLSGSLLSWSEMRFQATLDISSIYP